MLICRSAREARVAKRAGKSEHSTAFSHHRASLLSNPPDSGRAASRSAACQRHRGHSCVKRQNVTATSRNPHVAHHQPQRDDVLDHVKGSRRSGAAKRALDMICARRPSGIGDGRARSAWGSEREGESSSSVGRALRRPFRLTPVRPRARSPRGRARQARRPCSRPARRRSWLPWASCFA